MKKLLRRRTIKKWKRLIEESGLFDEKYYLFTYPDVRSKDIDPIMHYLLYGTDEGRNPNAEFNTLYYIKNNTDVATSDINPLYHFIKFGQHENRPIKAKKSNNNLVQKNIKNIKIDEVSNATTDKNTDSYFDELFSKNNIPSPEYVKFEQKEPIITDIRLIAFYLPQFHPIPENDIAWGRGFTEWTNVSKAIPQFKGHYQPRLPGELGYYDLRMIETQKRQIELAKNYGLHGFCYHYYWFGGKKILDTPLQQVLNNPDTLDFPFCINWANENWTKRWDGLDQEVILKQNHSLEDDIAFLEAIKPILTDKRYIKIDGKALLMVYRPQLFPNVKATVKRWREHAKKIGIGELYLILSHSFDHQDPREIDFDAATEFAPNNFQVNNLNSQIMPYNAKYQGNVYDYKSALNHSIAMKQTEYTKFKSICPSWDNEARKPGKGTTFYNANPENFSKWLEFVLYNTYENRKSQERIIFINAWNEWAEGAYLEPDRKYGYAYLDICYKQMSKFNSNRLEFLHKTQMQPKTSDTAIILHLYYVDLWDEIKIELENFNDPIDLYININNSTPLKTMQEISTDYPTARIYTFENRGRDIYPFIQTMKILLPLKYDYICKIHSKKSLHRKDGDQWRNHLIKSLIGSPIRIEKAKQSLQEDVGIVSAKGNIFNYSEWIGSNKEMVEKFAQKASIALPDDFVFPAGSMFWFKPQIMEKLVHHFDSSLLPFEEGQIDGTKAHAVERLFGLLCHNSRMSINEI